MPLRKFYWRRNGEPSYSRGNALILTSFQVDYPRERVGGSDEEACRVTLVTAVG